MGYLFHINKSITNMKTKEQKLKYKKPAMRVFNLKLSSFICISGQWGLID